MFNLRTVNDVFVCAAGRGDAMVVMEQSAPAEWKPVTSRQLYGRVRALVETLRGWGVQKGDRVALLAENRWEWPVTDFAVLAMGAVDVPLYPTLSPEQIGYMLNDAGVKVAIVSSAELYQKIVDAGDIPTLQQVVVMDAGNHEGAVSFSSLMQNAPQLESPDAGFDATVASIQPGDLATIIYTSGTTGEPKGVMLTHGNLASNLNYSTGPLGLGDTDVCISFLPLSHVTARHLDYALLCHGTKLAYCAKFDQLPAAMKVVKPTMFVAVPRVFEKIKDAVAAKSTSSVKRAIFGWASGIGKAHRKDTLAGVKPGGLGWALADKIVFSKIRDAFGGRGRIFIAGGAPLGLDTAEWFADLGIEILEGYGLTETSPVIALNYPKSNKLGTVGKPLPNVQCRIAADGELEVKGPSIFSGYWKKDKETKEAFTGDGWFHTGDIANIDSEGYLSITDRKKELLKTSGGKLIAPAPIENKLKANVLVGHAAMVGDKHKFASVLISPNLAALKDWAKGQGVTTEDAASLVKHPKVVKVYEEIVESINGTLSNFETIKRVCVVPDEWSVEDGTMTPSMKLKRRVVNEKYAKEIATFYNDEATSKR